MSKKIYLHGIRSDGKFVIVDDDDYEWLNQWKWYYHKDGYASRGERKDGKYRKILMHREVIHTPSDMHTDHVNGDGLDNRKSNLRICTRLENMHNRRPQRDSSSKYKGVYYSKRSECWGAYITVNGKRINLGYFNTEEDAARVVDRAAIEYHGDFARLNFPNDNPLLFSPRKRNYDGRSSKYRGVSWKKDNKCWSAQIVVNGKSVYLGLFSVEEDAARAYNKAAIEYFGTQAQLNFLKEDEGNVDDRRRAGNSNCI